MVIGTALQVEKEQVSQGEITIPRMFWRGVFVTTVVQMPPMQAAVLDVVDDLQQDENHHQLAEEENRSQPVEDQAEAKREEGTDGILPSRLIVPVQGR